MLTYSQYLRSILCVCIFFLAIVIYRTCNSCIACQVIENSYVHRCLSSVVLCYINLVPTSLQLTQNDICTVWPIFCITLRSRSYRNSVKRCKLHKHAALFLINQCSKLIVCYSIQAKASNHLIAMLSNRSTLAMRINLRSDNNITLVQIIINPEVDVLFLLIQTCDIQLIKLVQLYLRQIHLIPIQYRNILALFWAAWLVWSWRFWFFWFYNQLTCSLDIYIASIVLWHVLFKALDELLHLFNWEIFLATIIQLLHILIGDILFALLQQCYYTTSVWQIFLIFLKNLLCIYVWNIIAIFLNQYYYIIIRDILLLGLENLFQILY